MSQKVGYARVSTAEQNLDLQQDALSREGCSRLFKDVASGAKASRPGLNDALDYLRTGDTLVVWKLDRLGRSLANLIEIVKQLNDRGIGFKSLQENIDTTSTGGKLVFHIFSSLAEFERDIIRDRTKAGLAAARARGRKGGRPQVLTNEQIDMIKKLHADKTNSITGICKMFKISRPTLYAYLKKFK